MSRASLLVLACMVTPWACGESPRPAPEPTYVALGGEAARVGDATLGAALVADVARARGVPPPLALADLVEDALAAQGARAQGLDGAPGAGWAMTAALGRGLSLRLGDEARAQGSPRDDELAQVTVMHAVVLRSRSLPEARALFTARAIADAVAAARTPEEFQARAQKASSSSDVRARIEELPSFDAAGHMENGQQLDLDFTVAAFALHAVGETSPIVETPFGWHVIRLLSRVRPAGASLEQRRAELEPAVLELRARGRLSQLLRERRAQTRVDISEGADELMAEVTLER